MNDEHNDQGDIVISSRIRLARNIAEFPFVSTCSELQRGEIEAVIREGLLQVQSRIPMRLVDASELEALERSFLLNLQRGRSGSLLSNRPGGSVDAVRHESGTDVESEEGLNEAGVLSTQTEHGREFGHSSITINEEDHLRLTVTRNDFDLTAAWEQINELDDLCEQNLHFAFSSRWGYLTACPANVGTGMRVSVLLHLPALVKTGQIEKTFRSLQRMNVVGRGVFGEAATGDLFRVSNQATLGRNELELIEQVGGVVPMLVKCERQAREFLVKENREGLRRDVSEALERLCRCDLEDESDEGKKEILELFSRVRMGAGMGLVTPADAHRVQRKFALVELRHQLLAAIAREDYGDATRLRDEIEKLETGIWHKESPE